MDQDIATNNATRSGFQPMYEKTVLVTAATDRYGFAVTEAGEKAYIPKAVMLSVEPRQGYQYRALLVDNPKQDASCPWLVARLMECLGSLIISDDQILAPAPEPATEPASEPAWEDLGRQAVQLVQSDAAAYWTTSEILDALLGEGRTTAANKVQVMEICNALQRAHIRGEIACAVVKQYADQEHSSFRMWAKTTHDFVGDAADA